ncbi:MAG: DEAD/DEAH box helicase [Candidatus Zixiibacteriota bacterium]
MELEELQRYGVPQRIIDAWLRRQGETLLPVQRKALRHGLLERSDRPVRMLVSSPTSSGKSFCAELAMVRALMARQKTVMLFPLKSLVEQNIRLLKQTYGPLGISCLPVSSDYTENDAPFARLDFQTAVAIYEKFDQLLTSNLDVLASIGLIVVDEIQSIAEPGRGATLEKLLTKILASVYQPSILALSAVVGDSSNAAGRLADWMDATLVEETLRPVDLLRGVAAEGQFKCRSFNEGRDWQEKFAKIEPGECEFEAFVRQIKADSGSTLIFLKSRQGTIDYALKLAASVDWPPARTALKQLEQEETSYLIRSLRQAMSRGVAFHSSDLSPQQRRIVEQAFFSKEIRVLFSTTTLAMGVNLSADTVYLETVKYVSGEYGTRPALIPVSRAEFENMAGRAGRLGTAKEGQPGRAIVLAASEFDRDVLWGNYISAGEPEPIESTLDSLTPEDWLLDACVSGLVDNPTKAKSLLERTLYTRTASGLSHFDLNKSAVRLREQALLESTDVTLSLKPTVLGRAVATSGLSVTDAMHYLNTCASGGPNSCPGWIALALSSNSWSMPPGMLRRVELADNRPLRMLYDRQDFSLGEVACLIGKQVPRRPLAYRQAAALKATLLLDEWCRLTPLVSLEERYQLHLGQILTLAETAAHRISATGLLLRAADNYDRVGTDLPDLIFSLKRGFPASYRELCRHMGSILTRADFGALHAEGINDLADLMQLSPQRLEQIIEDNDKRKNITDKLQLLREAVDMRTETTNSAIVHPMGQLPLVMGHPERIEIDGRMERERFLVRINDFPIRLTGKSFMYFTKLAWSRQCRDSGWVFKEDIEIGFNQARYLYRMKNEVNAATSGSWSVFENNRLGYYRLSVDPSRIHFNREMLREHPDYEVRRLFEESKSVSAATG